MRPIFVTLALIAALGCGRPPANGETQPAAEPPAAAAAPANAPLGAAAPVGSIDRADYDSEYDYLVAVARLIHAENDDPDLAVSVSGPLDEPMIVLGVSGPGVGPVRDQRCAPAVSLAVANGVTEDQIACVLSSKPEPY